MEKAIEDIILDQSTIDLTAAVVDLLEYLQKLGINHVYAYDDMPSQVFVTGEFFDRNFPEAKGRARIGKMEFIPTRLDCPSM